jgi:hypothetical protein
MYSPLQFPSDIDKYRNGGYQEYDNINRGWADYKASFVPPSIKKNPMIPIFDRFGLVRQHAGRFVDALKQGAGAARRRLDTYRSEKPKTAQEPPPVIDLVSPDLPPNTAPLMQKDKIPEAPTAFEVTFSYFHPQDGFQKLTGTTDTSKYNAQDRTWEVVVGKHVFFVDEDDIDAADSELSEEETLPPENKGIFVVGDYVTVLPEYARNASRDGQIIEKHVNRRETPVYKILMENGDSISVPEYRLNYQFRLGATVIYKNSPAIVVDFTHSSSFCDLYLYALHAFVDYVPYDEVFVTKDPLDIVSFGHVQEYRVRDKVYFIRSDGSRMSAEITDAWSTPVGFLYRFRPDALEDDGFGDYADTGENLELDTTAYKKNLFQGKHTVFGPEDDEYSDDSINNDDDDDLSNDPFEHEPMIDAPMMTRRLLRLERARKTNSRLRRERAAKRRRYRPRSIPRGASPGSPSPIDAALGAPQHSSPEENRPLRKDIVDMWYEPYRYSPIMHENPIGDVEYEPYRYSPILHKNPIGDVEYEPYRYSPILPNGIASDETSRSGNENSPSANEPDIPPIPNTPPPQELSFNDLLGKYLRYNGPNPGISKLIHIIGPVYNEDPLGVGFYNLDDNYKPLGPAPKKQKLTEAFFNKNANYFKLDNNRPLNAPSKEKEVSIENLVRRLQKKTLFE